MKRLLSIATLNMTNSAPGVDQDSNDIALMAAIANGDRDAFQAFLSRHLSAVVQFARRYLASNSDAEDIAQETFFRVWQKASSWTPRGHSPRSWLYRIAYNLCIDEIRRRPLTEDVTDDTVDGATDYLETTIENTAELERLAHSLKQLPERQNTAISLCALQGLSNKEAAAAMDISIDALESLLARGRRQLRNHLQQDGETRHE
jgi:RNA polymerase sigma-70 factor (ECF subfamily)